MFYLFFQVKKNILNVDFHVSRYGQIVEELRKEVRKLTLKYGVKNSFYQMLVSVTDLVIRVSVRNRTITSNM